MCLAHDLGHPPFGHSGEDALKEATRAAGGFDHNAHTLRILTRLETPYPCWDGLNLTWETLEGLAKHNGPVAAPGWALAEVDAEMPLDLARGWRARLPAEEPHRTRHIGDFIAGMTDRYALARYREVVGPVEMPEGV